jgi:hypothetical protein
MKFKLHHCKGSNMEKVKEEKSIMPDPPLASANAITAPKPRKPRSGGGITVANLELSADELESKRIKEEERNRPKRKYTRKAKQNEGEGVIIMADASKLLAASPSNSEPAPALKQPIIPAHSQQSSAPFATAVPSSAPAPPTSLAPPPPPKPIGPNSSVPSFNAAVYKPAVSVSFMPAVKQPLQNAPIGYRNLAAAPPSLKKAIIMAAPEIAEAEEKESQRRLMRLLGLTALGGAIIGVGLYLWGSKFVSAVSDGVAQTPASVARSNAKHAAKGAAKLARKVVEIA